MVHKSSKALHDLSPGLISLQTRRQNNHQPLQRNFLWRRNQVGYQAVIRGLGLKRRGMEWKHHNLREMEAPRQD